MFAMFALPRQTISITHRMATHNQQYGYMRVARLAKPASTPASLIRCSARCNSTSAPNVNVVTTATATAEKNEKDVVSSSNRNSSHDSAGLVISALNDATRILGASLKFPRYVLVGDQSSGKTSLVEAIVGAELSVKDQTMATRRPLMITTMQGKPGMHLFFESCVIKSACPLLLFFFIRSHTHTHTHSH